MPRTQLASSGKQSGGSSSSATPSSGSQRLRRSKPNSASGGSPAQTAVKPILDKDELLQQERTGGGRNGKFVLWETAHPFEKHILKQALVV